MPRLKDNKVIIIAEAGINHNGDISIAKKMIFAAAEAGADYVKFQTFISENLVSDKAELAEYQKESLPEFNKQLQMLKKLELDKNAHLELIKECEKYGIHFLSTAFDLESIDFLTGLKLDFFKIPSGEITNYPYLKKIAQVKQPVVMSTGMSNLTEINQALNVLIEFGLTKGEITLLHCNTEYPTPMADVNLNAMNVMRDKFDVKIGYSDHTLGIEVPIAAVALGATVIEKHFTLDRNMEGPDQKASLEPDELKNMTSAIRNIEAAMGRNNKEITRSEKKNRDIARKSIHAKTNIRKGEKFSDENLVSKRPGIGISPMRWNEIIGQQAKKDYKPDEIIEL